MARHNCSTSQPSPPWLLASQTFAALILFVCYIIGTPLMYYTIRLFYNNSTKPYIIKRNPPLFYCYSICVCIYIFICAPLEAISCRGYLTNLDSQSYPTFVTIIFQGMLINIIFNMTAMRFWYTFIHIRLSEEKAEWRKILNPNYPESWVEKYYHIITNWKYMISVSCAVCFIFIVCTIVLTFVGNRPVSDRETNAGRFLISIIAISGFFTLYIFMFVVHFVDYWYIRDEFRFWMFVFFISGFSIAMVSVPALIVYDHEIGMFNYTYITFIVCISLLIYQLYATKIIIVQNNQRNILLMKQFKKDSMKSNGNSDPMITSGTLLVKKFKKFISTKEGYCEIMKHITREFSTENLLFLTVLTHFENFLHEFQYFSSDFQFIEHFEIPDDIPVPPPINIQLIILRERLLKYKQIKEHLLLQQKTDKIMNKAVNAIKSIHGGIIHHANTISISRKFRKHTKDETGSVEQSPVTDVDEYYDTETITINQLHSQMKKISTSMNEKKILQIYAAAQEVEEGGDYKTNILDIQNIRNVIGIAQTFSIKIPFSMTNDEELQYGQENEDTLFPLQANELHLHAHKTKSLDIAQLASAMYVKCDPLSLEQLRTCSADESPIQNLPKNGVYFETAPISRDSLSMESEDIVGDVDDAENDIYTKYEFDRDYNCLIPIFEYIYKKYLSRSSAPLEINISFEISKQLEMEYRKMSINDGILTPEEWHSVFCHLQEAAKQVMLLLYDSYSRFWFKTNQLLSNNNFYQ